jgi:hypothetical protein
MSLSSTSHVSLLLRGGTCIAKRTATPVRYLWSLSHADCDPSDSFLCPATERSYGIVDFNDDHELARQASFDTDGNFYCSPLFFDQSCMFPWAFFIRPLLIMVVLVDQMKETCITELK